MGDGESGEPGQDLVLLPEEASSPAVSFNLTAEDESVERARLRLETAEPDFPRHGYCPDNALQLYLIGSAFKLVRAGAANPEAEYLI